MSSEVQWGIISMSGVGTGAGGLAPPPQLSFHSYLYVTVDQPLRIEGALCEGAGLQTTKN